jgi:hypothetical protein
MNLLRVRSNLFRFVGEVGQLEKNFQNLSIFDARFAGLRINTQSDLFLSAAIRIFVTVAQF